MNKTLKRVFMIFLIIIFIILLIVLGLNFYVIGTIKGRILTEEEASKLEDVDCILVLGADSGFLVFKTLYLFSLFQIGLTG